jgi:hypothetical protein
MLLVSFRRSLLLSNFSCFPKISSFLVLLVASPLVYALARSHVHSRCASIATAFSTGFPPQLLNGKSVRRFSFVPWSFEEAGIRTAHLFQLTILTSREQNSLSGASWLCQGLIDTNLLFPVTKATPRLEINAGVRVCPRFPFCTRRQDHYHLQQAH